MQSVNVAVERTGAWTGRMGRTGIDKRPAAGAIELAGDGVAGDTGSGVVGDLVADTRYHGGRDQAVYAFDAEDLAYWSHRLGQELVPGNAGENLTLAGCDGSAAVVGQRWRLGSAVLRVTAPRVPCRVFAGFWDVPKLVKAFTQVGRTGAYLAVERQGSVSAGDELHVLSTPEHGVTLLEVFAYRAMGRRDLASHVATARDDLPREWAERIRVTPA